MVTMDVLVVVVAVVTTQMNREDEDTTNKMSLLFFFCCYNTFLINSYFWALFRFDLQVFSQLSFWIPLLSHLQKNVMFKLKVQPLVTYMFSINEIIVMAQNDSKFKNIWTKNKSFTNLKPN